MDPERQPPESAAPEPAYAPPTRPTAELQRHRSSWPGVLGVLLCVFGGIGLLQRIFGVGFMALMPVLPLPPEAKVDGTLYVFGLVLTIVGLPLAIVHLMAGIQTLRRKPSARTWVVVFFVYAVLIAIPNAIYQYFTMQQQMQQAAQQSGQPAMAVFGTGFGVGLAIIGTVMSLLWPTFLLIWYSWPSIREEMSAWGAA